MMRKRLIYSTVFTLLLILGACKDYLNLEPLDKVSKEYLLSTPAGVKTLMATLYNRLPIEDFVYGPGSGFNVHPGVGGTGAIDGGWSLACYTDEAIIWGPNGFNGTPTSGLAEFWGGGSSNNYESIRYVNQFLSDIADLKAKGKLDDATYNQLFGEAHFIRADIYFAMVKRYGGVPIIDVAQPLPDNIAEVLVPRSTEKATWDFVMSEYDLAAENLPDARPTDGTLRATKWVALAHKSRAALHAASVAKYWNDAPLTGPAVDAGLVGMTPADATNYYQQCIDASALVIANPSFSLYKASPAPTRAEAVKNYQEMFESPSYQNPEIIFMKSYIDGTSASGQGHPTDFWFTPKQLVYHTAYMSSRWGTTLDVVDAFEDYTDNNIGASSPIRTRTDNAETTYQIDPKTMTVAQVAAYPFVSYTSQYEPFTNKDARLQASVLLPGSSFKSVLINMQGGLIRPNGALVVYTNTTETVGGITYSTYGAPNSNGYSAFADLGTANANYSSTGFALRKFMQENKTVTSLGTYGSTQGWIDIRLAEIYLNYAEAVAENPTLGSTALAATYLNAIRKRAAHTDNIPLSVDNVLKERRVELIFEHQRYWDLMRRRDFHTLFPNQTKRHSLIPIIDLRQSPPKYVFLRANNLLDQNANGFTFQPNSYYKAIPGVATNKLVQNPGY